MLSVRSIDTMKISRDYGTGSGFGSVSNADKITHANSLALQFPAATHFTVDCYYETYSYQTQAYVQEWADAIHATGKKIWWRGVPDFSGLTAAQSLTNISNVITNNPTWFANGDIFEFYPESNPYIFSNPPDNWNNSTVLWSQWIADMIASCNTAFANIGKSVTTTIQSIVSSYYTQGDVKATAIAAMNNQLCIDFYPFDDPSLDPTTGVTNMMNTLNALHATYPTAHIIISETGATNAISSTDSQQQALLQAATTKLLTLPYVTGMNYWVGYGYNFNQTNLYVQWSLTDVRPAASTIEAFYLQSSPTTTSTSSSTSTSTTTTSTSTSSSTTITITSTSTSRTTSTTTSSSTSITTTTSTSTSTTTTTSTSRTTSTSTSTSRTTSTSTSSTTSSTSTSQTTTSTSSTTSSTSTSTTTTLIASATPVGLLLGLTKLTALGFSTTTSTSSSTTTTSTSMTTTTSTSTSTSSSTSTTITLELAFRVDKSLAQSPL